MLVTQGRYFSVDPGRSACVGCRFEPDADPRETGWESAADRLAWQLPSRNRAIGPIASILGALVAMEALRYLTRFEEPVAAGVNHVIDFAGGCAMEATDVWERRPDCSICAGVSHG